MRRLSFSIRFILPLFLLIFLNLIYPLRVFAVPTYGWTKTIGGIDTDKGQGITVDSSGNIYTTGYFLGEDIDFNPGTGTDLKDSGVGTAIFITKINSDGSYGWTKVIEGVENCLCNMGNGIAADSSGNIYVTGGFAGVNVDFDSGAGTDLKDSNGGTDIFITKINSDGSYGWTRVMGGPVVVSGDDSGYSISTDLSGNIYTTGYFLGTDIDFDPDGAHDLKTSNGGTDIFITKINSDGSYGWTKTIGGTDSDVGNSITNDSSGNVYTTGYFSETNVDFNFGVGNDLKDSNGGTDIFITKINSDGTYGWTGTVGDTESDYGYSIATDSSGNIFISGGFVGESVDFNFGAGTDLKNSNGASNALFITKINSDGTYGWTKAGGAGVDGLSITTDSSGNI
jgi:hypothetical protein